MRKSTMNQVLAQFRAEVAELTTAKELFASVREFALEANHCLGEPPAFGLADSFVEVALFRTNSPQLTVVDFYLLRENGNLEGHREMFGESIDHVDGPDHPITAEEFVGAFVQRVEVTYRRIQDISAVQKAFASRIVKPVIEVCRWNLADGRSVARLASTGFEREGGSLEGAVTRLLFDLGQKGMPKSWNDYTVVLIRDFDTYTKNR